MPLSLTLGVKVAVYCAKLQYFLLFVYKAEKDN